MPEEAQTEPNAADADKNVDKADDFDLEGFLAPLTDKQRELVLSEGGRKALTAEREAAKKARSDLAATKAQLNGFLEASKTDEQRREEAIASANTRATAAMQRVARAEVKAALAGVVDNPDAIVDDLNLSKFVDDDGEVDAQAIAALREKYATFSARRAPRPDSSQASAANGGSKRDPAAEFGSILQGLTKRS